MARVLPFNDFLAVSHQPEREKVRDMVFGDDPWPDPCEFVVWNNEVGEPHLVRVHPDEVRRKTGEDVIWLEGWIVSIDGRPWGPPANRFNARFDSAVQRSAFKIIHH
jgi:hypothetical protein